MGQICGHFSLKGWVKIVSYTRPLNQIFQYERWAVSRDIDCLDDTQHWVVVDVSAFKKNSKGWVVKLVGYDSREVSQVLIGNHIGIDRSWLEPLAERDYYWIDLIGLSVINLEGVMLGKIDHLIETGANDVMVVHSEEQHASVAGAERLLPWTATVVTRVDLENGVMTVDWKEYY